MRSAAARAQCLRRLPPHGWRTADADHLCHELYAEPEGPLARQFAARWGREVLTPEGAVDRRRLGAIVFADRTELEFLTGTLYPELSRKLDRADCRLPGGPERTARLSFRSCMKPATGINSTGWPRSGPRRKSGHARLREQRKFSEDEIRLREARQLPADAKLERADFGVINNDGLAELELQIGRLVRLLNGSVR